MKTDSSEGMGTGKLASKVLVLVHRWQGQAGRQRRRTCESMQGETKEGQSEEAG